MTTEDPATPVGLAVPGLLGSGSAVVDMDEQAYHKHPALSQSGAKDLLPPSCPAIYRYRRDNPPEPEEKFDVGHGVHSLVLGVGAELVEIAADDWRKVATKERAKEIRADGKVPLLTAQYRMVHDMAEQIRRHKLAGALLTGGQAEVSLFWQDVDTGANLRGRLDYWRPDLGAIVDFKTTAGLVHRKTWGKVMADYSYHMQASAYLEGVRVTGLCADDDPVFFHVVQSKQPPYLVQVFEPDRTALDDGAAMWRDAIDIFAECTRTGEWPSYSDDEIQTVSLPAWYLRAKEAA